MCLIVESSLGFYNINSLSSREFICNLLKVFYYLFENFEIKFIWLV